MSNVFYKVRTCHDVVKAKREYPKGQYYVSGFLTDAPKPITFSPTGGKVFTNEKAAMRRAKQIHEDTEMHCEVVPFHYREIAKGALKQYVETNEDF